jgi:hypothetical protein
MNAPQRFTRITFCCCIALLFACARTGDQAADTAGATGAAEVPQPTALTAADVAGRWNMRAVPETGDTTATTFVLTATDTEAGWTQTFPKRKPIAMRVTIAGDSIISEAGPFESVRRKGVQVRTNSVMRLQDGNLVGNSVAHYVTKAADSVLRLRLTGTRAR